MLFNSFEFLIFFVVVFILFFSTKGTSRQGILFLSSCFFYAWFIPKYLLILFLAIAIDYYAAIKIEDAVSDKGRKVSLLLGIVNTCAILFIFKYHNFFIDNINWASGLNFSYWNLILPIGLSFHTFQSLSYVIDVYRKKVKAERNLLLYSNYVMMFPQLVAGPIERAGHLFPQLHNSLSSRLNYSDFTVGLTLFFYGLFKKMVVADSIGPYVDAVYNNYTHHTGVTLLIAAILFAIQIYADFSGYSDMAIGIARALGYKFNDNFRTPYFSRSFNEFWHRWHISLSTWFRDYVYFSFGGSRVSKIKQARNILIVFLLSGFWHGANWTFVVWGAINGFYLIIENQIRIKQELVTRVTNLKYISQILHVLQTLFVFMGITLAFIFFRATNMSQATTIFKKILSGVHLQELNFLDTNGFTILIFSSILLFLSEYFIFTKYSIDDIYTFQNGKMYCLTLVVVSILLIFSFGWWGGGSFIYFQF